MARTDRPAAGWNVAPAARNAGRIDDANEGEARCGKVRPRRHRERKAEQRAETLEQILDAAEFLFSKHGLYGVTLRDVALKVGVHTSLMHYYFEDKLALFKAVFARRARVTSDRRMEALERIREARRGDNPPSKARCTSFWIPTSTSTSKGGEGLRNYAAFCAQRRNTPEGAELLDEHFDPVVLKLVAILKQGAARGLRSRTSSGATTS